MPSRVYLAGPDVFLPEPTLWLERKKAICAGFGLTGVSPLDECQLHPIGVLNRNTAEVSLREILAAQPRLPECLNQLIHLVRSPRTAKP